ncbi:MAG: hypothetical protein JNJ46_00085 [Myxococcales bacterium]|nr:hypothetical protein [Myxococcales bacterium]
MGWSEPEPVGERGTETSYRSRAVPQLAARLVFDCHAEPRRLEVTLPDGKAHIGLRIALRPLGRPVVIGTSDPEGIASLLIVDRPGYFRLNAVPGRLQALVRKAAPLSVVAELLALLEAALGGPRLHVEACTAGALSYATGALQIDDARCTACLDCVRPLVHEQHVPPAQPVDDEARPGRAPAHEGA